MACNAVRRRSLNVDECVARIEQPMMISERRFDFGILRQDGDICSAQALGRLALGETIVVNAMLRHDARGFLSDSASQVFSAWTHSLAHLRLHADAM